MGNCQAAEAAAVVIQHPGGKVERLYGAATAAEVMRGNPGHYVALVVLSVSGVGGGKQEDAAPGTGTGTGTGARITKVKLLKPKDTLLLGQVYRLITSQEVAKAIQARREDKMRRHGAAGEVVVDDDRRAPRRHAAAAAGEVVVDDDRRAPRRHAAAAADAAGSQGQGRRSTDQVERKRPEKSSGRQHRSGGGAGGGRGRHWQPSLQSISEAAS